MRSIHSTHSNHFVFFEIYDRFPIILLNVIQEKLLIFMYTVKRRSVFVILYSSISPRQTFANRWHASMDFRKADQELPLIRLQSTFYVNISEGNSILENWSLCRNSTGIKMAEIHRSNLNRYVQLQNVYGIFISDGLYRFSFLELRAKSVVTLRT